MKRPRSIFQSIADLLRSPPKPSAEYRAALDALSIEAAEAKVSQLEAERRAVLLSGDDAAHADVDAKIGAACRELERTIAAREELQRLLAQAEEREGETERRRRYEAARAEADEAAKALKAYAALCRGIVNILETIAKANVSVAQANASLPIGASPLTPPEMQVRGLPGEPEEIISTTVTPARWRFVSDGAEVPESDERKIRIGKSGTNGMLLRNGVEAPVQRVPGRRRTDYMPARPAFVPESLAATIMLPGLEPGSAPFWQPCGQSNFAGAIGGDGEEVVAAAADLRQAWQEPPSDPRPRRVPDYRVSVIHDEPATGAAA